MCYKNYTISLCSLNLLIFGVSILAVSSQCLYDLYSDRLSNEHNIYLTEKEAFSNACKYVHWLRENINETDL